APPGSERDVLLGGDVLPGFRLSVAGLFAATGLDQPDCHTGAPGGDPRGRKGGLPGGRTPAAPAWAGPGPDVSTPWRLRHARGRPRRPTRPPPEPPRTAARSRRPAAPARTRARGLPPARRPGSRARPPRAGCWPR